jgi:ribulose-bisphosphate carboxylase large chain
LSALRVRYRLRPAAGEDAGRRAAHLAREQTIEIAEGAADPEVERRAIGRVAEVAPDGAGRFAVTIDYPLAAIGGDLLQLLNVLWGNVSLQAGVRVESIEWPRELLERLPGPAFGVEGVRELCRAHGRPLTATALKPLGLSSRELARRAAECALGGIDLVKDDHGLGDQEWAPFRERVLTVADLVERANRSTGGACLYAPNLTGSADRIAERLETLAEAGVRAALVAPALVGLDALRALAETSGLVLLAHPAFAGSLAGGEHGLAPELLFGDLFRLAGADAVVFPNAGGRFPWSYDDCRAIERRLGAALGGKPGSFLMLGGGVDRARLAEWVPRYGPDTIWLVGGSLYARADLRAAAREMAEAVSRTPPGRAAGEAVA